jgi:hypothetical protein
MLYNLLFNCEFNLNQNFVQIEGLIFDLPQLDIGILFFPRGAPSHNSPLFLQPAQTMTNIAFGLAKRLHDLRIATRESPTRSLLIGQ